jgi:two-component system alkaline phosphatase synthesis response regulator PhoP
MIRVLIIEDEINIAKMLQYDFKQLNYEVSVEHDGYKGYQKAKNEYFDIILLDLMLPSMNGLEICKKLRSHDIKSYIIMLTAMDDEYNKIEGFEAGADDYVTKPFSPRELSARMKAALRRQVKDEKPNRLTYNDITLDLGSYEVFKGKDKVELTHKEFELLEYLIMHKGKALSREQLLSTLWGYSYDGDTRVVDVHIFKLREKIDPETQYIKTVRSIGYKLV